MNIRSIKGDIAELAPDLAELSVLWIRSGFNRRYTTWEFGIHIRYPRLTPLGKWETVPAKPWLAPSDQVLEIHPPDRLLAVGEAAPDAERRYGGVVLTGHVAF